MIISYIFVFFSSNSHFNICCTLLVFCPPPGDQMVQTETIMTGIVDNWPTLALNWKRRILTVIAVCFCGFLIGLPMSTQVVMTTQAWRSFRQDQGFPFDENVIFFILTQ
jgi:hypothetical protein